MNNEVFYKRKTTHFRNVLYLRRDIQEIAYILDTKDPRQNYHFKNFKFTPLLGSKYLDTYLVQVMQYVLGHR